MSKINTIIKLLETDKEQAKFELEFLEKILNVLLENYKYLMEKRFKDYKEKEDITDYASYLAYQNCYEHLRNTLKGEE